MKSKGFTLIELLVVIAIIGILAALVLVALGNARDKANDARVKADIGQLRTLAEVIYDSGSASYTAVQGCFNAPTKAACGGDASTSASVSTLRSDISAANGGTNLAAGSTASGFCVEAKMNNNNYICVDSTGVTKDGHTASLCTGTSDTAC